MGDWPGAEIRWPFSLKRFTPGKRKKEKSREAIEDVQELVAPAAGGRNCNSVWLRCRLGPSRQRSTGIVGEDRRTSARAERRGPSVVASHRPGGQSSGPALARFQRLREA